MNLFQVLSPLEKYGIHITGSSIWGLTPFEGGVYADFHVISHRGIHRGHQVIQRSEWFEPDGGQNGDRLGPSLGLRDFLNFVDPGSVRSENL